MRQNHETVGELAVEILAGQLQHNKYGVPEIPHDHLRGRHVV